MTATRIRTPRRSLLLLGPAFVAAIAYVDPGNVAANLTSGARFGYLLVWVIVVANLMAMLIQYQSAKLGLVTGKSLPEILGERMRPWPRRAYWVQAEIAAMATDIAEVIGGAIALKLLFDVPLPLGGVIVGLISMVILSVQNRYGQHRFEIVILGLLAIITVGFLTGLLIAPPDPQETLSGLIPRFEGSESVLLAASMLGATVMPHAIYLHSALARDRHRPIGSTAPGAGKLRTLIRATRIDVTTALAIAGAVNLGMLLLAAATLRGVEGTDSIEGAHGAITSALGPAIGAIFAIGLLASGLASTSVGSYAGANIMAGLVHFRVPLLARRAISLIPALALLMLGVDPTWALILSQVVLSFGIPFALIPLLRLTANRDLMGQYRDNLAVRLLSGVSVLLIIILNLLLIYLTVTGNG
ncbi:Nramp family divalent metal transporter [Acaricomes phytoseiuli]|uniref:Nramp family divalent metal transporter n=1 Tax=Acaricomes phytoseiuli TaxID=291968 RepID=UPI000380EE7F|nr:Nramp family divalent metal transporter [Acaricomes phytoseiuli]MCW1249387.1 Nramp family divalent metal transporter [Acaricomes phytoseiuli]